MTPALVSGLLFMVGILIGYELSRRQAVDSLTELRLLRDRYRQALGWHDWFGTYDIESFDGGKMWYSMETESDGRRLVKGSVEQLYPGLLSEPGIVEIGDRQLIQPKPSSRGAIGLGMAAVPNKSTVLDTNINACAGNVFVLNPDKIESGQIRNQAICRRLPQLVIVTEPDRERLRPGAS